MAVVWAPREQLKSTLRTAVVNGYRVVGYTTRLGRAVELCREKGAVLLVPPGMRFTKNVREACRIVEAVLDIEHLYDASDEFAKLLVDAVRGKLRHIATLVTDGLNYEFYSDGPGGLGFLVVVENNDRLVYSDIDFIPRSPELGFWQDAARAVAKEIVSDEIECSEIRAIRAVKPLRRPLSRLLRRLGCSTGVLGSRRP